MRQQPKPTGRIVTCSNCSNGTSHGTTQVHRKIVFHFCPECWTKNRPSCDMRMART